MNDNKNYNIYLTKELKKSYMIDFNRLLNIERDFWKIDDGLKEILISINENEFIQTLYSKKKHGVSHENLSYLKFCFSSKVERELYRNIIPSFAFDYNTKESKFHYSFYFPKENENYREKSELFGLDCVDNKNYFYVNHIGLFLDTWNPEIHSKFWNEVRDCLSRLGQ